MKTLYLYVSDSGDSSSTIQMTFEPETVDLDEDHLYANEGEFTTLQVPDDFVIVKGHST